MYVESPIAQHLKGWDILFSAVCHGFHGSLSSLLFIVFFLFCYDSPCLPTTTTTTTKQHTDQTSYNQIKICERFVWPKTEPNVNERHIYITYLTKDSDVPYQHYCKNMMNQSNDYWKEVSWLNIGISDALLGSTHDDICCLLVPCPCQIQFFT